LRGERIVSVRLTPEAQANGMALALPQVVLEPGDNPPSIERTVDRERRRSLRVGRVRLDGSGRGSRRPPMRDARAARGDFAPGVKCRLRRGPLSTPPGGKGLADEPAANGDTPDSAKRPRSLGSAGIGWTV